MAGLALLLLDASGERLAHAESQAVTTPASTSVSRPEGNGDQVVFYYDTRDGFTTFLNLRNEGGEEMSVRVLLYDPALSAPFSHDVTLPALGARIIDAGGLKASGLPARFGVAFATAVNGSGQPIVSRVLSGNFTVANLATGSAWGAAGAARVALQAEDTKITSTSASTPVPGTPIDGATVAFTPIKPVTLGLAVYYDPSSLEPASRSGNQLIFVSFDDQPGNTFVAHAAPTTWNVQTTRANGETASVVQFAASGVNVTDITALAGSSTTGSGGSMIFAAGAGGAATRMILFTESLGTFGTGYFLPPFRTSFSAQVQPIFTARCATTNACHVGGDATPLDLSQGLSYSQIVGVGAVAAEKLRVAPGDPAASYLFDRITGVAQPRMPLNASPLPSAGIETVRRWILEGARDD